MIRIRRKQKPEERVINNTPLEPEVVRKINFEPATSPPPTLYFTAWVRKQSLDSIKVEYQMTIRPKVTNLSSKEASMLLMVCNVEALSLGLDLSLYMSMEFLYSYLTRSGSVLPEEIKEERIRQTCLLTHLILSTFRGEWNGLGERIHILNQQVREAVIASNWLPNLQTFNSWKAHWRPDKWLEVRIVPLDYILDRSKYSEPYSGYCKGYGEGTSRGAKKTPYSSELDGENYEEPQPPEFNLLEVEAYLRIHSAIEQIRAERVQGQ